MRDQNLITPIDQYLIDFIRDLRISKNLTQDDIANIIGITRSYISDIESINSRAKYNIRHINSLADYFNMSPKEFFPDKPLPLTFRGREKKEKAVEKSKTKNISMTRKKTNP